VAVTEKDPVVDPAVYRPDEDTVPPVAVQLTAVLLAPVTVAVNWRVAPAATEAEVGEMETETAVPPETVAVAVAVAEPPAFVAVNV
jgi:hypothetical protein